MTVEDWFGLQREAFSIAPDPAFLYPSEIHREALELLHYGLQRGASFVLLTGAIGAGKTTVWRRFLERLPASVDVASVVNPRLDVTALLGRICDDLQVDLPSGARNVDLIDALHGHLLLAHAQGRRTLIAIDEAQALSADVLEQLRLLTNLDADGKKLQVMLIGQPELRQTLARPDMEPLSQRVVARYHLPALSEVETARYIAHRLQVAGLAPERMPFDADAVAAVHRACRGVPRRINAVCDRALVLAHAAGTRHIGRAIVEQAVADVQGRADVGAPVSAPQRGLPEDSALAQRRAASELAPGAQRRLPDESLSGSAAPRSEAAAPRGRPDPSLAGPAPPQGPREPPETAPMPPPAAPDAPVFAPAPRRALPAAALGALVVGALWFVLRDRAPVAPAQSAALAASAPVVVAAPAPAPSSPEPVTPPAATVFSSAAADEGPAWRALAAQWGVTLGPGDACAAASQQGLRCLASRGGLAAVRQFDRPALLRLADDGGRVAHVLLLGVGTDSALLSAGGSELTLPLLQLARLWRGEFSTLWRVPPGYGDGAGAPAAWLAPLLGGVDGVRSGGGVDEQQLAQRVAAFQQSQGLASDGIAGPLTLIQLNRASGVAEPRLRLLTSGSRPR